MFLHIPIKNLAHYPVASTVAVEAGSYLRSEVASTM